MSPRIQALVSQFVENLTAAIQEEGAAAFKAAIAGGTTSLGRARAPRANVGRKGAQTRRRKGAKRDPKELAALTEKLGAFIKKTPGQRIEQIGKAMGTPTKDLALPVKKLIEAKKISTKGQKRATTYFPR